MTTDVPAPLQMFVDCFNICYSDWELWGDATQDLKPSHVDYDENLRSSWGRCGPRSNGEIYYRINTDWWNDHTPGERLGLIIHELGHVKHCPGHPPAFWELVVDNYFDLAERPHEVEEIMGDDVRWSEVVEFIVDDPHNGLVDNRKEVAYERRLKLAEALGYPTEDVEPFDNMRILTSSKPGDEFVTVPMADLHFERKPPSEVVDYFHARPRPKLRKDRGSYIIAPPLVKENGDGTYHVVENDEVASLAATVLEQSDREKLTVELTD